MLFRLLADPRSASRWHLGTPVDAGGLDVDPRLFTQGERVSEQGALRVPLRRPGEVVSFNFADFDMVVTLAAVNARLEELAGSDVQRIPVNVLHRSADQFEILNVCRVVSCIDESRSEFLQWGAADGRPEKVGTYRMITKLVVRPDAASAHDIFRIAEWPIALVVSERVRDLFEEMQVSGVKFQKVS